ncbi:MAG: potassium-transporting ATPase subunit F [Arsenophonus sp. NC-TX2-MAG3]
MLFLYLIYALIHAEDF